MSSLALDEATGTHWFVLGLAPLQRVAKAIENVDVLKKQGLDTTLCRGQGCHTSSRCSGILLSRSCAA